MARIRSIKPEFFTSAAMAALPLSARLTFIGLWTYVDDNGVGLDNERLVLAAVWPLEDDAAGTLQRTREDLRRLAGAGHIRRYRRGSGAFLHITTWEEHQRVSHPRKPRYPQPTEPGVTCENTDTPETLPKPSGETPEPLRPEQGAGSREQGAGSTTAGAVNSNVEGTPRAIELPSGPWLDGSDQELPAPTPQFEAERKRQMDALMREYPEVAS